MAGSSRIVINDQGITISTGGKVVFKAAQHTFEGGASIPPPKTVLPNPISTYSHKINYNFKYTDSNGKELDPPMGTERNLFVVEKDTSELLAQRDLNKGDQDTSLRFHSEEEKPFNALIFHSEKTQAHTPDDHFFHEDDESEDEE